jgi:hypothetical protein
MPPFGASFFVVRFRDKVFDHDLAGTITNVSRTCLFCPSTPMSREHIWPEWMVEIFPESDYKSGRRIQTHGEGLSEQTWSKKTVTHKASVVCKKCNETWMSQIEQETKLVLKPIIEEPRTKRQLNLHQQALLANWAALHAMVFQKALKPDSVYYSEEECWTFADSHREGRKPILNTHVWLALLPDMGGMGVHGGIHSRNPSGEPWRYSFFNSVFGRIAVQAFHWSGVTGDWIGNEHRSINLRKLDESVWRHAVIRIWPRKSISVTWPPRKSLTHAGIRPFYNRFFIP